VKAVRPHQHEIDFAGARYTVICVPWPGAEPVALTAAETAVARLAAAGLSNAEIGRRRGSTPRTVANQMAAVLRKLGLGSRHQLAAWWSPK